MSNILVASLGFGLVTASIIAIGAMGFTLQFGLTNILNISFGAMMTSGAMASLVVERMGGPMWLVILVAPAAGALLTLVIGRYLLPIFSRRGSGLFEMVMVTLAIGLVLQYLIDAIDGEQIFSFKFPEGSSLHFGPLTFTVTQLVIIASAIALFLGLEGLLKLTRLGKALRAMAGEPRLARSCGIPTSRIVNVTWLLSGAFAGLGGLVYVINSLTVDAFTGADFLPLVLGAAILGRAGSSVGAVTAAVAMGMATEIAGAFGGSAYSTVAGFGLLVIVLLTRPGGLIGDTLLKEEVTL